MKAPLNDATILIALVSFYIHFGQLVEAIACAAGTYYVSGSSCTLVAQGSYSTGSSSIACAYADYPGAANCQQTAIVRTLAGGGTDHNGIGTNAVFNYPRGIVMDSMNMIYIADSSNNMIKTLSTNGKVTVFAGSTSGGLVDGIGTNAKLNVPYGSAFDTNYVMYIVENTNSHVRTLKTNGQVATFSTSTSSSYRGVTAATDGSIYATETSASYIYKFSANGDRTIFAGKGSAAYADGSGTNAAFSFPNDVKISSDGMTLFVTDMNNQVIRTITTTGTTSTFAGLAGTTGTADGALTSARFNTPFGIAIATDGTIFVTAYNSNTIRKISAVTSVVTTIAGGGSSVDGLGTSASFMQPGYLLLTSSTTLYVCDSSRQTIRTVSACSPGYYYSNSACIAVPAGYYKPSDGLINDVYYVCGLGTYSSAGATVCIPCLTASGFGMTFCPTPSSLPTSQPTGQPTQPSSRPTGEPTQPSAQPSAQPTSRPTAPPSSQPSLRATSCVYGTYASGSSCVLVPTGFYAAHSPAGACPYADYAGAANCQHAAFVQTIAGGGGDNNGVGTNAKFSYPTGMTMNSLGIIYIADSHSIKTLTLSGNVTVFAGSTTSGNLDGIGTNARLNTPYGIAAGTSTIVYIGDYANYQIRKIKTTGEVAPFSSYSSQYMGLRVSTDGSIYATDTMESNVCKFSFSGSRTVLAGKGTSGYSDGSGTNAAFNRPFDIGISTDGMKLFVCDSNNHVIRVVTMTGITSTFAGLAGSSGIADGTLTTAQFNRPWGIAVATNGILFVSAYGSHTIRMISAATSLVTTIAGHSVSGTTNGVGTAAAFNGPMFLLLVSSDILLLSDSNNNKIRTISGCSPGYFYANGACTAVPAGYYKPTKGLFNDVYYVCGLGTFSSAGATACSPCSTVTGFGMTSCPPSSQPTSQPTGLPTQPSSRPTCEPTQPSTQPTSYPTNQPTMQPTSNPSSQPTTPPTAFPSFQPSANPTGRPSRNPSSQPSALPTGRPTRKPSGQPNALPTSCPSRKPSGQPSALPTGCPSMKPSDQPSVQPTEQPTGKPSMQPSGQPTTMPTIPPSNQPSTQPSSNPSSFPSPFPSAQPSSQPKSLPTKCPSALPTAQPSITPTCVPSTLPSSQPSSLPTLLPTAQPSIVPTLEPSTQPSGKPTRQPTAQPTRQPTEHPSVLPSAYPTCLPTSQPTSQPSRKPSLRSTSKPSVTPTLQPSNQPSGQPTRQPTAQPTRQPTEHPSVLPSAYPTCLPTSQPTSQPSRKPSLRPTSKPSVTPTLQPSNQPSGQPTRQPSACPSSRPSSVPSILPSVSPTLSPTSQPTSQPSRKPNMRPTSKPSVTPTLQPSGQPTGQPSKQPTSHPSDRPTDQPTAQPTNKPQYQPTCPPSSIPSSVPSMQPSSCPSNRPTRQPSSQPTSHPSLSASTVISRWRNEFAAIQEKLVNRKWDDPVSYVDISVNGKAVEKACLDWNQFMLTFYQKSASTRLRSLILMASSDIYTNNWNNDLSNITCSDTNNLVAFQNGISAGDYHMHCNGNAWNVAACGQNRFWYINASQLEPFQLISPCSASCGSAFYSSNSPALSYARMILATFALPQPPIFVFIRSYPSRQSITVASQLDAKGTVYCRAMSSTEKVKAVQDVIYSPLATSAVVEAQKMNNLTLSGLTPATDYTIYCAALSDEQVLMTYASVVGSAMHLRTQCCRKIFVSLKSSSVSAGSANPMAVTIRLDTVPSQMVRIQLSRSLATMLFPYDITVSNTSSKEYNLAFTGTGTVGTYPINITVSGSSEVDYVVYYSTDNKLTVRANNAEPPTPFLTQAMFSSDGAFVKLLFSAATDYGAYRRLTTIGKFKCDNLLSFIGASMATCQWEDATLLDVYYSAAQLLSVNSTITLLPNTIKASWGANQNSSQWLSVKSVTLAIRPPDIVLIPRVTMSLPAVIGSCDDLVVDYSASTGSGGRPWAKVDFVVFTKAPNISDMTSYLQSAHKFDTPVVVPREFIQSGYTYNLQVTLCNWLGGCSFASATVAVTIAALPSIGIIGAPLVTVNSNSSLKLSAVASLACSSKTSAKSIQYSWSMFTAADPNSQLQLKSISADPSKFLLAAYSLQPATVYTCRVTVMLTESAQANSASIIVSVASADLIVIIAGGSKQVARASALFALDATASYDSGQGNRGRVGIRSRWSCQTVSPFYSDQCSVTMRIAPSSFILNGIPTDSSVGQTLLYSFVLFDDYRTASGTVNLQIVPSAAPLVSVITTFASKVDPSSSLVIQATIKSSVSCAAAWLVSDPSIDLTTASLVPPTQYVIGSNSTTNRLFLSIVPNTLPTGMSLDFTLQCITVEDKNSLSLTSSSTVTVTTNRPPSPGSCAVSPITGTALSTPFSVSASNWVDTDIPLQYQFGFISPTSGSVMVLKSKSGLPYGSALLAAGAATSNYSLIITYDIFDSFSASTRASASIQVMPMAAANSTSLSSLSTNMLSAAAGNTDSLKQAISVLATTISTIDCSHSPNCTALHRYDCVTTANTCGSCLPGGYLGAEGDSNEACIRLADMSTNTGRCKADSECSPWSICDSGKQECVKKQKKCPQNCFGPNGNCKFLNIDTRIALTRCDVDDPNCIAECICASTYYGSDCGMTEADYNNQVVAITNLIGGLQGLVALEDSDDQSTSYWIASLTQLVVGKESLFNSETVSSANQVMSSILDAVDTSAISIGTSQANINSVVNSLLGITLSTDGRGPNATLTNSMDLIDMCVSQVSSAMVSGQVDQTILQLNYRVVASVNSANLTVPVTALEQLQHSSTNSLSLDETSQQLASTTSIISLPARAFAQVTSNTTAVLANSIRILIAADLSDNCVRGDTFLLQFANIDTGDSTTKSTTDASYSSNITIKTLCYAGEVITKYANCSATDQLIPIHCSGNSSYAVVTTCPVLQITHSCQFYDNEYAAFGQCELVSYTNVLTTCRCSSCLLLAGNRKLNSARRLNGVISQHAATALAISTASYTEYASVLQTADNFNSLTAVKDVMLVISLFAIVWFSGLSLLIGSNYVNAISQSTKQARSHRSVAPATHAATTSLMRMRSKLGFLGQGKSTSQADMPQQGGSLQYCLEQYVAQLFSPAFSEDSDTVRFVRELWSKHLYLSVFTNKAGIESWIKLFYLLTNLTTNFFLLALFYDIQFPRDDGTCGRNSEEHGCLVAKSVFNSAQTKCLWMADTQQCVWRPYRFHLYSNTVVAVTVLFLSVPLAYVILLVVETILLAPSAQDLALSEGKARIRRGSELMRLNRRTIHDASALQRMASQQQHKSSSSLTSLLDYTRRGTMDRQPNTLVKESKYKVLSTIQGLDTDLRATTIKVHQLSQRTMIHQQVCALDEKQYRSLGEFLQRIKVFYGQLKGMERISPQYREAIEEFEHCWGSLIGSEVDAAVTVILAQHELSIIISEAEKWVELLKSKPKEQIGIQLMELFVQDCLGHDSREAKIFFNKVNPFTDRYVMTTGIKAVTFALMCLLNLYFIFSCMLYGKDKGLQWQRGWLYTCVVNLFVDVFINSVTVASVVHYFVPNMILPSARSIRASVLHIIRKLCANKMQLPSQEQFSVTSYFFVSTHVARAFPDMLESRIVLSNLSHMLSHHQMIRIMPHLDDQVNDINGKISMNKEPLRTRLLQITGKWIITIILLFGSQSRTVQETLIAMLNPMLVSVMAFIGISIVHGSWYGIFAGALVVASICSLIYYIMRHTMHAYDNRRQRHAKKTKVAVVHNENIADTPSALAMSTTSGGTVMTKQRLPPAHAPMQGSYSHGVHASPSSGSDNTKNVLDFMSAIKPDESSKQSASSISWSSVDSDAKMTHQSRDKQDNNFGISVVKPDKADSESLFDFDEDIDISIDNHSDQGNSNVDDCLELDINGREELSASNDNNIAHQQRQQLQFSSVDIYPDNIIFDGYNGTEHDTDDDDELEL